MCLCVYVYVDVYVYVGVRSEVDREPRHVAAGQRPRLAVVWQQLGPQL